MGLRSVMVLFRQVSPVPVMTLMMVIFLVLVVRSAWVVVMIMVSLVAMVL